MKFSPEITVKIKTFIKDKLIELNSYVDDELPEYIVVLSSHKKPRNSLIEDLKLFLGRNTEKFVDWLLQVLQDLEKSISHQPKFQSPPLKEEFPISEDQVFLSDGSIEEIEEIDKNDENSPPRVVVNRLNFDENPPKSQSPPKMVVTFREEQPEEPQEKARIERCKFWPCCKNGESCPFHHPNKFCRMFPNCKFGDKCIYIHPNCVFDLSCTRPNCPYTHTNAKLAGTQRKKLVKNGRFSHGNSRVFQGSQPKIMCRFGVKCTNRKFCQYSHPVSGKYKWVRTEGVSESLNK